MDEAGRVHGDVEAYVDGDSRMTFHEWSERSRSAAVELNDRGVRPGDIVALLLPSGIDFAIAYVAALRLGAVVTGINLRLGAEEVDGILDLAPPAVVVCEPAGLPPGLRNHQSVTADVLSNARSAVVDDPWQGNPTDPAVIIWTSGSTGRPKGAWFDHAGLAAAVHSYGVLSGWRERRLFPTPFAHAGYMAKVWEQLASGATLILSPQPWSAPHMARILREERIDVAGGVPTMWAKLLELPESELGSVKTLRVAVSATAPAPPELVESTAERLGAPMVVRYAMTESPSITGTEPGDSPEVQWHTVGRPQWGVQMRIVGPQGDNLPPLQVGEIQVRGPGVMRGYWNDVKMTQGAFSDGWLRTGDLGYLREEGNLVLTGRAKEIYIRGGYNVYPLEVELVLSRHPGVARAAVVGVPAPTIGEIGCAFIVPVDAAKTPSRDELRHFVKSALADYKAPDEVVVVDDLPLNRLLKVDKPSLLTRASHILSRRHEGAQSNE